MIIFRSSVDHYLIFNSNLGLSCLVFEMTVGHRQRDDLLAQFVGLFYSRTVIVVVLVPIVLLLYLAALATHSIQ